MTVEGLTILKLRAWTSAIDLAASRVGNDCFAIFLGGDHSISAGVMSGLARRAAARGRPLFVLWLDAHPDFHTLDSTVSGNLHGVPLAYATGQAGFEGYLPRPVPVAPERVCAFGLRHVDTAVQFFRRFPHQIWEAGSYCRGRTLRP